RGTDAPCTVDADCAQNLCVSVAPGWGKCSSGAPGSTCADASDCTVPFCVRGFCSAGTVGSGCGQDAECATHECAVAAGGGPLGQCTDGKVGSPCWGTNSTQCEAGLHCTGAPGLCAVAGGVGARCNADGDCQSQKCGGAPDGPTGLAVCTDG